MSKDKTATLCKQFDVLCSRENSPLIEEVQCFICSGTLFPVILERSKFYRVFERQLENRAQLARESGIFFFFFFKDFFTKPARPLI